MVTYPNLRSDLGPLTTTFTPTPDCTGLRFIDSSALGLNIAAGLICDPSSLNEPDPFSTSVIKSCFPDGFASFYNRDWLTAPYVEYIGVYSPASICPLGYTVACTQARSKGQSNPFENEGDGYAAGVIWSLLNDGETASGCCPTGYGCHNVEASMCVSHLPNPITLIDTVTVKCPGTLPPRTSPTAANYAYALRVVAMQAATPEHTATRTTTSAPTSSASASSIPSENTLPKPSQGLPLAAKIAIGVVIPLVAILSGAACFFIYRYRRKRKLLQAGQGLGRDARSNVGDDLETTKPELPGDHGVTSAGPNGTAFRKAELAAAMVGSGGAVELPAELAGGGLSELHGDPSRSELDSMSQGLSVIDVVGQDVNNQHADERSKGLWQWSNYQD